MSPATVGFLQAQNIDPYQFKQIDGLQIQHQLTHELVDILDKVADYAASHSHEIYKKSLTDYCANLAHLSQQSNVQGALPQAIDGINCCHGLQHYLAGMASGISQRYNQIQTAMDYFDIVIDSYGDTILQHAAQGFAVTTGIETIIGTGMIAAPTVTVAATTCMMAATAMTVAPICAQALLDTTSFASACIVGN